MIRNSKLTATVDNFMCIHMSYSLDSLHVCNALPPNTMVMAYANGNGPQSPDKVCRVELLQYRTRTFFPAILLMVSCDDFEGLLVCRESNTVTDFAEPCTVSQCLRTGENRTCTECTNVTKIVMHCTKY